MASDPGTDSVTSLRLVQLPGQSTVDMLGHISAWQEQTPTRKALLMTLSTPLQDLEDEQYEPDLGDDESGDDSYPIDEFDLVSSPNDFNTKTLVDFIDSGVVNIPGFQRNFIWDVKRASRLIESIIVGLPVPQIFLYEQKGNNYLVIDGQQRLMSIYYFVKGRFPRKEQLATLRLNLKDRSAIPSQLLDKDEYFTDFRLNLPESVPGRQKTGSIVSTTPILMTHIDRHSIFAPLDTSL